MPFLNSLFGKKGGGSGLITIREFRDRFVAGLKIGDPSLRIGIVDDRTVTVQTPGGDQGTVFMQNSYAQYADDPQQMDVVISGLVKTIIEMAGGIDQSADAMVVVARHVDYGKEFNSNVIVRPLAGDLGLLLAFDGAASLKAVERDDLKTLSLTEDEAFAKATQVLRSRIGALSQGRFQDWPVFYVAAESGLATGALALPNLWGNPDRSRAVFVDTKEMFFWAYLDDAKAVGLLRQYATERMKTYDTISKTVIAFDGAIWKDIGVRGD